jgi:hypothetical protein
MLDNGEIGQVRRSVMLGTVADLAKKADAQMRLDAHLRPLNQRNGRPEATMRFGVFVETQWTPLVLPTFKRTTQQDNRNVLNAPRRLPMKRVPGTTLLSCAEVASVNYLK